MAKTKTEPKIEIITRCMRTGMQCPCGRLIGIVTDCDPPLFYDQNKWEVPVTHCPACNTLLTLDMLVPSGIVQPNPMVEVLRILARRGRLIREQEERELAARKASSVSPSEVPLERSADDAPNQPPQATTVPPLDLPSFRFLVAALPYPALFFTVSGAHLYGFPSSDSDVARSADESPGTRRFPAALAPGR